MSAVGSHGVKVPWGEGPKTEDLEPFLSSRGFLASRRVPCCPFRTYTTSKPVGRIRSCILAFIPKRSLHVSHIGYEANIPKAKQMNHVSGSLEDMVENLVKNWEVEASFKPQLSDWRTVDHDKYTFAINGGPPQSAEHMLKVGTYNAIIAPNEYYSPDYSDFASSHKTFKRMMPTFAWEVLEVYSGPPTVAFKWRHWGTMKNDYVGFNE